MLLGSRFCFAGGLHSCPIPPLIIASYAYILPTPCSQGLREDRLGIVHFNER